MSGYKTSQQGGAFGSAEDAARMPPPQGSRWVQVLHALPSPPVSNTHAGSSS